MFHAFYDNLNASSPAASVIISIAIMLFFGFAMTRLTKAAAPAKCYTAYIVTGIIIGPYCLDLIPENIIAGTDFYRT